MLRGERILGSSRLRLYVLAQASARSFIETSSVEDHGGASFCAGGSGGCLFSGGDVEDVGLSAARGEGFECGLKNGVAV